MFTDRPDPGGRRGRAENNNCLRGGFRGRKTSGVYQLEKNRLLSVALSPLSARPLMGGSTHSWALQQNPILYI